MTRDLGQDHEMSETLPGFQDCFGEAQDLATAAKEFGVNLGDKGAHKMARLKPGPVWKCWHITEWDHKGLNTFLKNKTNLG